MHTTDVAATGSRHQVDLQVGARVRQRRLALGWDQARLAAQIGTGIDRIDAIERGQTRPSANEFYDIAKALQAPISQFFDIPDGPGRA